MQNDDQKTVTNTVDQLIEFCRKENLTLVIPDNRTLVLDIDNEDMRQTYIKNLEILKQKMYFTDVRETRSKSGKGWHVYLKVSFDLDPPTRLLLQCLLGSHSTREAHSYINFKNNEQACSFVFEKRSEEAKDALSE